MTRLTDTFVGQQARRGTRNLALATLLLICLIAFFALGLMGGVSKREYAWSLFILLVLLAAGYGVIRNILAIAASLRVFESHWLIRHLARYGDPHELAAMIDQELSLPTKYVGAGNVTLTPSWTLIPNSFGLKIIPNASVVWAYKKVTRTKAYALITIRTDHAAVIHSRLGDRAEVGGEESPINNLLGEIAMRAPWAFLGYQKALEDLWNKNQKAFIAAVDQRLEEYPAAHRMHLATGEGSNLNMD